MKRIVFLAILFFTTELISLGADCFNVTSVSLENAYIANNSAGDDVFKYTNTTSSSKTIKVSSCDYTTADTYLSLKTDCEGGSTLDYSDDYCNTQSQVTYDVGIGETVYIVWGDNYTSSSFTWSIIEEVDPCTNVSSVNLGSTYTANNSEGDDIFKYTNTSSSTKSIEVSSCGYTSADTYLYLKTSCEGGSTLNASDDACDTQSQVTYNVGAGETVYIVWGDNYTSSSFTWSIIEENQNNLCNNVSSVSLGNTYTANNSGGDDIFAYTNTTSSTKSIEVSSCGYTTADTYLYLKTSCEGGSTLDYSDDYCNSQAQVTYNVGAGETVYIVWGDNYTSSSFTWSIIEEGQNNLCNNVSSVSLGNTYTANNSGGDDIFAYTNTTSSTKSIEVSSCGYTTADTYLYLKTSCEGGSTLDYSDDYCNSQAQVTYNVGAGETVYIVWGDNYTSSSFTWSIIEEGQNNLCDNVSSVNLGNTYTANNSGGDDIFSYTNTTSSSKSIEISSCDFTTSDTYLTLTTNCTNGTILASSDDACDTQAQLTYTIEAGETIYIIWEDEYTSNSYSWNITESQNSACANIPSVELNNSYTANNSSGDDIFKYTNTSTEVTTIKVSSCGSTSTNTDLSLATDCVGGIILDESDNLCNQQSQLTYSLEAGETVYIIWKNTYTSNSYSWNLEEGPKTATIDANESALKMYPNPATTTYNLSSEHLINNIVVYSVDGRIVLTQNVENQNVALDVSDLTAGYYIIHVTTNNKTYTNSFMKK